MTALLLALSVVGAAPAEWMALAPGVEYRTFALAAPDAGGGGEVLHVVRVDPAKAPLDFALASQAREAEPRSCGAWAKEKGYLVAINAGMYATDEKTNVGYLRHGAHENNGRWNESYQSALVFGPTEKGLPAAQMLDRDGPDFAATAKRYRSTVQNLRLIKGDGVSVWKPNGRKWSEAALAIDASGRVLFLFARSPFEMVEFNRRVLALPLGIVKAMHLDGGPPACLSIHAAGLSLDLSGNYESGFFDRAENARQWRVPNVLGVKAR